MISKKNPSNSINNIKNQKHDHECHENIPSEVNKSKIAITKLHNAISFGCGGPVETTDNTKNGKENINNNNNTSCDMNMD